jgi:hypothetical protein
VHPLVQRSGWRATGGRTISGPQIAANAAARRRYLKLTQDGVPMHPLSRGKRHVSEKTIARLWDLQKLVAPIEPGDTEAADL